MTPTVGQINFLIPTNWERERKKKQEKERNFLRERLYGTSLQNEEQQADCAKRREYRYANPRTNFGDYDRVRMTNLSCRKSWWSKCHHIYMVSKMAPYLRFGILKHILRLSEPKCYSRGLWRRLWQDVWNGATTVQQNPRWNDRTSKWQVRS